jgi:hypothetical protein
MLQPSSTMRKRLQAVVARMQCRPSFFAVLAIVLAQLVFTAGIRGYVVPQLAPASHWKFGLQHLSDSQLFYEHTVQLAASAREHGFGYLFELSDERMRHAQILAAVFYLVSSDNAWWIYLLNVMLAGLSTWLLILIGRVSGLDAGPSALLAVILGLSPQFLFLHSELLREPFIVPAIQLTWLGGLMFVVSRADWSWRAVARWAPAAVGALVLGFIASSTFRPYLMLPLLVSLTMVFVASLAWRGMTQFRMSPWRIQHATFAATLALLIVGYVMPEIQRVRAYAQAPDRVAAPDPSRLARLSNPQAGAPTAVGEGVFTAEDLRPPQTCTVNWQDSGVLPRRAERALESLACARESFQRYCDPRWYGNRIDRNCDETPIASAGDLVRHIPYAAAFGLLTPFPNMWLNTFGASGTGLRRVGYVVDGVSSYLLLPGLLGLLVSRRLGAVTWPLRFVALGIVAAIVAYSFAVPSQFILSRFRVGFYRPLLVLAGVGWLRLLRR